MTNKEERHWESPPGAMAPSGDDTVKLDVSEATEVSAEADTCDSETPEEYELELAPSPQLHEYGRRL